MSTENKPTEKKDTAEKTGDQLKDDFWDLDMMLPQKAPRSAAETNPLRDTEAVEINFGDDAEEMPEFAVSLQKEGRIPPIRNITNRNTTSAARKNAREAAESQLSVRAHTPGDVKPQMSVPVCTYTPEDSFIKEVSIFRWPSRYQYYERFTADALRYYNRTAQECPFVNFYAYMPQYAALSQDQLRWYLYWRDNVRHGIYLATDYSYIFLYVYEIINLPEKIKPEEGLEKLCTLWLSYRDKFPRLDRYMGEWVCDYCLVYELPAPLDILAPILPGLVDKLSFKEFYIRCDQKADAPFTASLCDVLSNYNWRQSKYVTADNRTLFEIHLYAAVLGALRAAWQNGEDWSSLLGLSEIQQTRNAFSGALCTYNCKRRIDIRYISLSRSYQLRFIITDLYKLAENCIRAHLGIKARLSAAGVPSQLKDYVRTYFAENLPAPQKLSKQKTDAERQAERAKRADEKKKQEEAAYAAYYEPLSTTLSPDAALQLEKNSWANTEMLVPEDAFQDTAPIPPHPSDTAYLSAASHDETDGADTQETDDPYVNFIHHLAPIYYQALKHIICMETAEYHALCQQAMLLPDAMADAINEVAVTYTDDTILDADGTFWKLSDYYANDVMHAVIAKEDDL